MLSFVLQRRDTREVDQIITLYTAERGKIDVLARGIKKSVAKNAAALEGPAMVEAEVANGKEFLVLTTATIVEPFFNLRKSYEGLAATRVILNILNELTPKGVPDEKVCMCVYKIFAWLNKTPKIEAVQVDKSVLEILSATGFRPEVEKCVVCGETFNANNAMGFSVERGGVMCIKHKDVVYSEISENVRTLFIAKQSQKKAIRITQDEAKSFHKIVYEFLVFHTGRHVPDWQ